MANAVGAYFMTQPQRPVSTLQLIQEPSTSRSEFQIEVRDPVKHGEGVSVRQAPVKSCATTAVHFSSHMLWVPTGTCLIQGHNKDQAATVQKRTHRSDQAFPGFCVALAKASRH